jgi:hypothetical protein
MGLERRKFVEGLNDRSLKLMLDLVNGERTRLPPNSEIVRGLEALDSQGYLLENPPYATGRRRHDVFVCHSSSDKRFARRVAEDLGARGFKVWFDEFEMLPGDSLYEKIQHGIHTAAWFVVVLSPDSVASKWCRRELHNALEEEFERGGVYVVPLLYQPCQVPGFLKEKLWADFRGKKYKAGLHQLVKRLGRR